MSTQTLRRTLTGAAFAVTLSLASGAHAQAPNRRFQRYMNDAVEAYQAGNPDAAIAALEHAFEIRQVPLILFNIARAHEQAGRPASAIEYYDRFLATNPEPSQAQTARDARNAAQAAIDTRNHPTSSGTGAGVATVSSAPPPGPTPHPREEYPRHFTALHGTLIIGGGALAIAGGILGGLALSASQQFAMTDDPAMRASLQDRGNGFAWGANIGIGVGAAALIAGTILYFVQDTHTRENSPSVLAGTSAASDSSSSGSGGMLR